jgi:hypothetical protein
MMTLKRSMGRVIKKRGMGPLAIPWDVIDEGTEHDQLTWAKRCPVDLKSQTKSNRGRCSHSESIENDFHHLCHFIPFVFQ